MASFILTTAWEKLIVRVIADAEIEEMEMRVAGKFWIEYFCWMFYEMLESIDEMW